MKSMQLSLSVALMSACLWAVGCSRAQAAQEDKHDHGDHAGHNHAGHVHADGTPTTQVCASIGSPPGCLNPFAYGISPPGPVSSPGTWTGFYDTLGRRYFVGLSMRF